MKNDLSGSIPSDVKLKKTRCYFHNSSLSGDVPSYHLRELASIREMFNNSLKSNISGELPASLSKPSFL